MPFAIVDNIVQWAGSPISPATTSATGLETSPVVRSINGKVCRTISMQPPPISSTVYYGPNGMQTTRAAAGWFDTQQTGATFVEVSFFANTFSNGGGDGCFLDETDNTVLGPFNNVSLNTSASSGLLSGNVAQRYWQVHYVNGAVTVTTFSLTSAEWSGTMGNLLNPSTGAQDLDGSTIADFQNTNTAPVSLNVATAGSVRTGSLAVNTMKMTGPVLQNNAVYDRTPFLWHGGQFSGTGSNTIWQPPSTNKVRLMKYKIEVAADATIAGGAQPINLQFNQQLSGVFSAFATFGTSIPYTHRLVIPGSTASSFNGWDSGWVDLGNGVLGPVAGRALQMGIQVPQSTAAITSPTWTIVSNQWEAATVGFKTNSNAGNSKLVQSLAAQANAATVAFAAQKMVTGNSYFVFFRTTNPAGGAPTITVTDTALNSYTTGTLVTNASDTTNGSSMGVAYVINAVGNAANVITVTSTVNLSATIVAVSMEYGGANSGGGIDAAQVSATGNSTAPASGAYTPSTAGDLVFTFMATGAVLAAVPTAPAAFVLRSTSAANAGNISIADNFGNGSLATGQINVIAIGTEE